MSFLNLTDVRDDFCIPAGDYNLLVKESELKQTKAMTGEYIKLTLEIRGGGYDGSTLFEMYNVKNPNEKAVNIGLSALKRLMKSAGRTNFEINSVGELCGLQFAAEIAIRSDAFGDKNYIKRYLDKTDKLPEYGNAPYEASASDSNYTNDDLPF
jgi:hypothetical protein